MQTVYIETTVISYLTSRPSRDLIIAAHQQITQDWWNNIRPKLKCVISPFVIQEISKGNIKASKKRLGAVEDFAVLALNNEIKELSNKYFEAIKLTNKSRIDAFHLAFSVWYKVDFLLTWNCTHIAGGRSRKILESINHKLDIPTPIICTPEELMEV